MPKYPSNGATVIPLAPKDPSAVVDYAVDWSGWLSGDTISSVEWTLADGITNHSSSFTDTVATIWLSGGTANTNYTVQCKITTAGGRTDERSFSVKCVER